MIHMTVNSKLPRTVFNPLFPSNYVDRELRKDQAAHRRETTCFGRNVANGLARMACYLGWHNYSKRYLIKARVHDRRTHAAAAGIPPQIAETTRRGAPRPHRSATQPRSGAARPPAVTARPSVTPEAVPTRFGRYSCPMTTRTLNGR